MPLSSDTSAALSLLERIQRGMKESEETRLTAQCSNDLNTLISVLESPIFRGIINIQDSLKELKRQVSQHPSIVPTDFDITKEGRLVLHLATVAAPLLTPLPPQFDNEDALPTEALESIELQELNLEKKSVELERENDVSTVIGVEGDEEDGGGVIGGGEEEEEEEEDDEELSKRHHLHHHHHPNVITNVTMDQELERAIDAAAQGREIHYIQLYKTEGSTLGFSVVGLRSEQRGELGIYVQQIQPTGIAAQDGRLEEGDQILAIDGQVLDSYISHQQAIGILQKATRLVELVVARAPPLEDKQPPQPPLTADPTAAPLQQQPPPTAVTDLLPPITPQDAATTPVADMLNTEWAQVEVIELVNDGSGLGFGIIGGRSTGVVVKTILPGGVADRDGRLQSGDHILQIGEVNLRGLGSDQVAVVLRQAGSHVRLVVARPIDPSSPDLHLRQVGRSAPIVETRVLNDPEELERRLSVLHNGYTPIAAAAAAAMQSAADAEAEAEAAAAAAAAATNGHAAPHYTNGEMDAGTREKQQLVVVGEGGATITTEAHLHYQQVEVEGVSSSSSLSPPLVTETQPKEGGGGGGEQSTSYGEENLGLLTELPEMENIELEITKDLQGLGITIAGYVCEQEELSGIFVKSINAGSAADRNGHIQVNDQIVQVDGRSLGGLSNHAAVDVLRGTGQVVRLRLARYLRGPKYEQLQQAIANSELKTTPTTPNPPRAPLGEAASSDALRSALGELEQTGDEETVEAINPSLHISSVVMPPLHPASTTIIADVPILPSTSTQPLLPSHYTTVTTTDVPELSSPPAALDVPPSDTRLEDIELMIDSNYSGEMPASVDAAINLKWSRIVGSEFDIVVAQLSKFEEGGGLGISLEGTVDVEGGREVRPHHYIRSILPDGPVGKNGRLCSGDELLEVNGQKLLGLNHVEVVGILKELPRCVRLVCGRRAPGAPLPLHPIDAPTANRDTFAARNILGGSLQNLLPGSERLVKAKSDGSLASSSAAATPDAALSRMKSRSLEPLTGLAMWSSECQVIELTKGDRGLGFSILDYQDPLNPQETVIVIRSLVPGGVAEKDGRLIPGDRLVAVNGTNLENATLDQAVAALKGAPRGTVSIAVAKPISVLESTGQDRTPDSDDPTVSFPRRSLLDAILGEHGGPGDGGGEEVDHSDRGSVDLSDRENNIYDLEDEELSEGQVYRHKHSDSVVSSELPPLPPSSPPLTPAFPTTDEDEDEDDQVTEYDNQASVLMVPVATERLIGSAPAHHHHHHHHATTSSTLVSQGSTGDEEGSSPQSSPQLPRWTPTPSLPRHLERTIKIKKGADQMGVNIEVVDQGVNGVVVSSLVRNGAVHKDGRLHAGDLILSVNNESMRNITNSQARAILRRTQLVSTDVSILFIRGQDAAAYREASLLQYREGQQLQQQQQPHSQQQQHQTSPRIFPKYYRSPYVPRGESSEDETTGEVGTDLTRSITAPSFITGDIPSRDPSQDDLLGSLASLQAGHHHPQAKSEGLSVISIKHALSETLVESRTEDPNVSSVHIDSETREAEDGEEGPFTITFKNVSAATREFSPRVGEEAEAEDHEVVGVLQAEGVSSGRPPGHDPYIYTNPQSFTNIHLLTGTPDSSSTSEYFVNSGVASDLTGVDYQTQDYRDLSGNLQHPASLRLVRFAESKGRSEYSESSDSSAERSSSLFVECDSDRHSVSDVLSDDLNPPSAKLVVAHITDVENIVQRRALATSRSYEEVPRVFTPFIERQYSEIIPDSVYLARENLVPCRQTERNQIPEAPSERLSSVTGGDSNRIVDSEYSYRYISKTSRLSHSEDIISTRQLSQRSVESVHDSSLIRNKDVTSVSRSPRRKSKYSPESNHTPSSATTTTRSTAPFTTATTTTTTTTSSAKTSMTITQGSSASPMLDGKHWGPERSVEVRRDDKNSLGISIVGGKVDLSWSGSSVTGIFIKNVLPESPAGKGGHLKTGDRILEVEGKDLRGATHEKAVEVIKNTGNPVTFLVQSLVQWTPANSRPPSSRDVSRLGTSYPTSISPARTPTPELIQPGITDSKRQELQAGFNKPLSRRQTTEDSDGDPDDERYEQGRIDTKKGVEIDRASAGAIRRNKADRAADTEEEDEFGYTQKKIQKKYQDMKGEVVVVELEKGPNGLGISLAGNRDRTVMSAFVCGLNPSGNAYKDGRIKAGDEILEVNGNVVYGRCHLNASCIFKGIPGNKIKIIVVRKQTGLQEMAIKPITTFPATLEDETPEERYGRYKGMAHFVMKKGQGGLGIMIIEGKHAEYGNGIFISDLQEGSVAAEAGLLVGDMILCVNKEDMCGLDYDRATDVLKKTEGVINMYVANAARVAGAKKAKPDVPPKPAIAPKPAVPAKPASLSSLPPHAAAPVTPPQPPQPHTTTPLDDPATSTTDGPTPPPPPAAPRPVPTDRLTVHHTVTPVTSSASSVSSTSLSPPTSLPAVTEEKPQDPATAEIRPGKETTIEIIKEKMGLGLSIVGGSDTLLGAIIIHEVYPDGAAAKDGRLKPGDQILNVNTENFREITHQKALSVLRQTPSKVKMVVYREEGTQKEEDLYDTITVQLTKKAGKGLGLSIVGRKNGPGVFISDVVPGGVAEGDGRLMQGDQILEVNDTDLRAATQEQAAAILKCAPGSVSIKLGRLKAGKKANANNNANSTWPVTISDSTPDSPPTTPPAVPPVPVPRTHQPPHPLHHHHHHHHHHLPPPQPPQEGSEPLGIRTILLERRDDGLGFSIVGGFGSNLGDLPIYVKSVFERGAAAREGSLRRGDQILEVNGQSLAGLTHSDAVAILKEARGSVALTILPSK